MHNRSPHGEIKFPIEIPSGHCNVQLESLLGLAISLGNSNWKPFYNRNSFWELQFPIGTLIWKLQCTIRPPIGHSNFQQESLLGIAMSTRTSYWKTNSQWDFLLGIQIYNRSSYGKFKFPIEFPIGHCNVQLESLLGLAIANRTSNWETNSH